MEHTIGRANASALLFALTVMWSTGWFLTRTGLESATPFSFNAARFLLAALIMQLILHHLARPGPMRVSEWIWIGLIGLLQTTLMFSLATYGLLQAGLARSAILIYSTPIWSAILGRLFLRETLSVYQIIGLSLGCAGILAIAMPGMKTGNFQGELLLVGSAISWSVASLLLKKQLSMSDKLMVGTWQMTFGSAGLLLLALTVDGGINFDVNAESVAALLYVSVVGSVMAFSLWFYIVPRVSMLHSSMATLAVPLTVLIGESLLSDERPDAALLAGSALILAGIALVLIASPPQRPARIEEKDAA